MQYGIPTIQYDYANNPEIFDPKSFQFDPAAPREKTLYNLRKAVIAAYKKAGIPNRVADEVATRNAEQILNELLNPPEVEAPKCAVGASGTVIRKDGTVD